MDASFLTQCEGAAEVAGTEAGTSAAIGFVRDAEHAAVLVEGIEEGDPEVLDTFPYLDLSGQWADGLTAADILDEIEAAVIDELTREVLAGVRRDADTVEVDATSDELVEAYRLAYDTAVSDKIESDAREIRRNSELDEIEGRSAYSLASTAECSGPDSLDSAGAEFLVSVRDEFVRRVRDSEWDPEEGPHEIADSEVPIYTWPKWRAFVDLGAWQEDLDDLRSESSDLDDLSNIALYVIAERLVRSLAEELGVAE